MEDLLLILLELFGDVVLAILRELVFVIREMIWERKFSRSC